MLGDARRVPGRQAHLAAAPQVTTSVSRAVRLYPLSLHQ